ncbi:g7736 [Coccomyxa elongata]
MGSTSKSIINKNLSLVSLTHPDAAADPARLKPPPLPAVPPLLRALSALLFALCNPTLGIRQRPPQLARAARPNSGISIQATAVASSAPCPLALPGEDSGSIGDEADWKGLIGAVHAGAAALHELEREAELDRLQAVLRDPERGSAGAESLTCEGTGLGAPSSGRVSQPGTLPGSDSLEDLLPARTEHASSGLNCNTAADLESEDARWHSLCVDPSSGAAPVEIGAQMALAKRWSFTNATKGAGDSEEEQTHDAKDSGEWEHSPEQAQQDGIDAGIDAPPQADMHQTADADLATALAEGDALPDHLGGGGGCESTLEGAGSGQAVSPLLGSGSEDRHDSAAGHASGNAGDADCTPAAADLRTQDSGGPAVLNSSGEQVMQERLSEPESMPPGSSGHGGVIPLLSSDRPLESRAASKGWKAKLGRVALGMRAALSRGGGARPQDSRHVHTGAAPENDAAQQGHSISATPSRGSGEASAQGSSATGAVPLRAQAPEEAEQGRDRGDSEKRHAAEQTPRRGFFRGRLPRLGPPGQAAESEACLGMQQAQLGAIAHIERRSASCSSGAEGGSGAADASAAAALKPMTRSAAAATSGWLLRAGRGRLASAGSGPAAAQVDGVTGGRKPSLHGRHAASADDEPAARTQQPGSICTPMETHADEPQLVVWRWPHVGDACLWGAALVVHLLQQRAAFELGDTSRRLLLEADLVGPSAGSQASSLNHCLSNLRQMHRIMGEAFGGLDELCRDKD